VNGLHREGHCVSLAELNQTTVKGNLIFLVA
jgi:hypothetical protein